MSGATELCEPKSLPKLPTAGPNRALPLTNPDEADETGNGSAEAQRSCAATEQAAMNLKPRAREDAADRLSATALFPKLTPSTLSLNDQTASMPTNSFLLRHNAALRRVRLRTSPLERIVRKRQNLKRTETLRIAATHVTECTHTDQSLAPAGCGTALNDPAISHRNSEE